MHPLGLVVVIAVALAPHASGRSGDDMPVASGALEIVYESESEQRALPLVDQLAPQTLLTITAREFDADTTGTVRQCVSGEQHRCRNELPVRFDDDGAATFQYLVTDDVATAARDDGACRLGRARCTIELVVGDKMTVVDTVFVDAAPPAGRVVVEPRDGLVVGDTVTVTATGFPAEAELTVLICADPAERGAERCGPPGPVVPLVVDGQGRAQVDLTLDVAEVGSDRVACGRRTRCRVVVTSGDITVRARPATLLFADAPGADYAAVRLAIGIAAAVALAAAAVWLTRSADWSPPLESDSSPIDDAEYADLDLEAELFEATEEMAPPRR